MFKIILAFAVLTAVYTSHHEMDVFKQFQEFTQEYNKVYQTIEEYTTAYKNFQKNFKLTMTHNHHSSHESGVTKFWDMSFEEFEKKYLNLHVPSLEKMYANAKDYEFPEDVNAPDAHDWRDHGAVGSVKDQASCGSCWAFSIVGNLEGVYQIKHGQFKAFSEQQIVDCDTKDSGCNGGWMEWGMQYVQKAGGIELQQDYPYKGVKQTCKFDKTKVAAVVTGNHFIVPSKKAGDEKVIKEMLFSNGPLSIAINASPLHSYRSGIVDLSASQCNPAGLNHGVTLVGYGTENGKDYWLMKNSWNTNWGEKGFFRYARGKGTCGVNTYVITAEMA